MTVKVIKVQRVNELKSNDDTNLNEAIDIIKNYASKSLEIKDEIINLLDPSPFKEEDGIVEDLESSEEFESPEGLEDLDRDELPERVKKYGYGASTEKSKFNNNIFRPSRERERNDKPLPRKINYSLKSNGHYAHGFNDEEIMLLDPDFELDKLESEFFKCKSRAFKNIRDLKVLETKIYKKYQEMYPDMSIEDIKSKFNY